MGVIRNDVGRPTNKTIMIRRVLKLVGVLIIVLLAVLAGYYLKVMEDKNVNNKVNDSSKVTTTNNVKVTTTNTENNDDDKNIVTKNIEIKELNVNDEGILYLFNKYNLYDFDFLYSSDSDGNCDFYSNDVGCNSFAYFYSKEKITKESLNDKIKLAYSIGNIYLNYNYEKDEYNIPKLKDKEEYDFSKINKKSIELFGSGINFNNIVTTRSNGKKYADACIYGNSYLYTNEKLILEKGGLGGTADSYFKTKITNTYEENNKLYIENKIMFIIEDTQMIRVLRKSNNNKNEDILYYYNKNGDSTININIDYYIDKLDTYRWTFTKDNSGNYTFESVEKVK